MVQPPPAHFLSDRVWQGLFTNQQGIVAGVFLFSEIVEQNSYTAPVNHQFEMTISFNSLGSMGRLGNQMFQYAALRGIASRHGLDWTMPPPDHTGATNYGLFDCFLMASVARENLGFTSNPGITTGQFHFKEEFVRQCQDDVDLVDYFQSEKYFHNVVPLIRDDFRFREEILAPCKELVDTLDEPLFLHVRRGDYVNRGAVHPVCSLEYYETALSHFARDRTVLVFSDDIDWCGQQALFSADRFLLLEEQERYARQCATNAGPEYSLLPHRDLCLMTLCTGGIMANSSMSWWGSYLQQDRGQTLVAPKRWFGPAYENFDLGDLYLASWKIV